ncbi:MAG: hypothetical protein SPM02_00850 [Bacteroidales bacterium]|nr:hypothetical protein [Bacteroidales bacterium]
MTALHPCDRSNNWDYHIAIPIQQTPSMWQFFGLNNAFGTQKPPIIPCLELWLHVSPILIFVSNKISVRDLYFYDSGCISIVAPYVGVFGAISVEFYCNIHVDTAINTDAFPKAWICHALFVVSASVQPFGTLAAQLIVE